MSFPKSLRQNPGERYWLLTLHPMCPPEWFDRYRSLVGANAAFIEPENMVSALGAADILVSDTSSIISEFLVLHKPVVTFRNRVPQPHILNFDNPILLPHMLAQAASPAADLMSRISRYADSIHPYRDGLSSERVIAAAESFIKGELGSLRPKPWRAKVRKLQIRRKLHYWGPARR